MMTKRKHLKLISMMMAVIMAMVFILSACGTSDDTADRATGNGITAPAERRAVDRDNPADYFNATWEYTMQQLSLIRLVAMIGCYS